LTFCQEWLNYPAVNFGPTVEKYQDEESFLTQTPEEHYASGDVAKVPWVLGFVPNEGNVYNIGELENRRGTRL